MSIYSVQRGNTLTGIAKAHNMSLKQLLDLNPELKSNPDYIQVGQKINLDKNSSIFPANQQSSGTAKAQKTKTSHSKVKQQTAKTQKQQTKAKSGTKAENKPGNPPISTEDGKFYAGMTVKDAKKKGVYKKSFWKTDFQDVDTNKDGKISNKEILAQRDKDTKSLKRNGVFNAVSGTILMGTGALTSEVGIGLPMVASGAVNFTLGKSYLDQAREEAKRTEQYRKQLNIKG